MRSDKIARLAGVTVRTLRHYHQIGLLPEPERSSNGYRDYSVRDLATLIRIQSFTELGLPLAEVGRVLDDPTAANELLEQIDAQAETELLRLEKRRRDIATLRRTGASPDLPTPLLPYASQLLAAGVDSPVDDTYEREQFALLSRFVAADGWAAFVEALDGLSDATDVMADLNRRFLTLRADASIDEWQSLADEIVAVLQSAVIPNDVLIVGVEATALLEEHQSNYLNPAQSRAITRVIELWEAGDEL